VFVLWLHIPVISIAATATRWPCVFRIHN
jgi:hypothetical protein